MRFLPYFMAAVLAIIVTIPAMAAPILPDAAQPGTLTPFSTPTPLPQVVPRRVAPPEDSTAPAAREAAAFILEKVILEGAVALPVSKLADAWQEQLGKPVSATELDLLLRRIVRRYRDAGILLGQVVVKELDPVAGILTLQAIEPGLANVRFLVDGNADAPLLENAVFAATRARLLAARPLRTSDLEEALLSLSDLPGLTATGTLLAENGQNDQSAPQVDFVIELTRKRWETFSSIDSRGSRYIGPWRFLSGATYNGLINPFDALKVQAMTGFDNQEISASEWRYQVPVTPQGMMLEVVALKTWSEPGYMLKDLQLENQSERLDVMLTQPFRRQRSDRLSATAGFSIRNSTGKFFGQVYNEDRTRSIDLGIKWETTDRWGGSSLLGLDFAQGIPVFDASRNDSELLSRQNGRSDFTKIDFYGSHVHPLSSNISMLMTAAGQIAATQLLAGEEFGVGGTQFGRAYDPSEIAGDHGLASLLEFQYTPLLPPESWLHTPQFYLSYDYGAVWRIESTSRSARLTASSTATGFRCNMPYGLTADLQIAKPLTRPLSSVAEDSGDNPRVFLSLKWNL